MRTLLSLLLLLCAVRVAVAGNNDAGVIVTGDASTQTQLTAQIETWLREHGHEIVATPLPPDAINTMIDCFVLEGGDERCARGVVDKRARATSVVYARIEVTPLGDGMRNITLVGYWFQKGADAAGGKRFCERCTDQTLRIEADALMTELAKSRERGSGRLRLTSTPTGAKVVIDGDAVGITPLDYDLRPGNHQVSLAADRHEIETRSVAIRVGETTMLDVPLLPVHDTRGGRRIRPLPVALVIGGVAALGTGIALIAIDEDESPTGPLTIRDTAPAGVAVTAVGGVALAAGVWLWLRKSDSGPVTTASRDGGYIGWFTRF